MSKDQLQQLTDYILASCPLEANVDDLPEGESPVDVATRLLGRMANGIDRALHELGVPGKGYVAPIEDAVKALREALGLWGKM